MSAVRQITVAPGDDGMRVDRWFRSHFPALGHGHLSKLLRTGQVRVDGGRAKSSTRLAAGQTVRVPPLELDETRQPAPASPPRPITQKDRALFETMVLHEDDDLWVLNKPAGLAVQGGSRTTHHIDGMLQGLSAELPDRPRLVHRLDRDTSGILVIAKTRQAAASLGRLFQTRSVRKVYWALVSGVPRPEQGKVDQPLVKAGGPGEEKMHIAREPGEDGAQRAITHYSVVDKAAPAVAWVSLKPVTGRQHQLRAHMAVLGTPILGDPKYGTAEAMPQGLARKLHLHARRITFPHPRGGTVDVTAPLPAHMLESFATCGFDPHRFDRAGAGDDEA